MALLSLRVPHEVARLLHQIPVEGDKTPEGDQHVTLVYLGKDRTIEDVTEAILPIFSVTSETRPFTVKTGLVTSFPKGDDGFPIIAKIESTELHDLQAKLCAALDEAGVEYDNKFPEYKSHTTLAYAKEAPEDQAFPPIEWGVGEMTLWAGNHGDEKLSAVFPFTLMVKAASTGRVSSKAALYRAYIRLACQSGSKPCTCGGQCSCQAQRVAARFDQARDAASTVMAADPKEKKLAKKLTEAAASDLKAFVAAQPAEANVSARVRPDLGESDTPNTWNGRVVFGGGIAGEGEHFDLRLAIRVDPTGIAFSATSGPHFLERLAFKGTGRAATAHLKKILAFFKEMLADKVKKRLQYLKNRPKATLSIEDVTSKLRHIDLGFGNQARSVDFHPGPHANWDIEPTDRQRLDHYVGSGYDPGEDGDPEGWDEDGWNEDYACPIRRGAKAWLDNAFPPDFFTVEVSEKGFVSIIPTQAGKASLGL